MLLQSGRKQKYCIDCVLRCSPRNKPCMYLLSDSSLYLILHFRLQNHFPTAFERLRWCKPRYLYEVRRSLPGKESGRTGSSWDLLVWLWQWEYGDRQTHSHWSETNYSCRSSKLNWYFPLPATSLFVIKSHPYFCRE